MIIDEIVLTNVGPYAGENRIQLTPHGKRKPITLLHAHNGGGKTTILDALNLCLFGKHAPLAKQGSHAYPEYLKRMIWDGASPEGGASICTQIRYQRRGVERVERIERHWHFAGSTLREDCLISVREKGGEFKTDGVLSERAYEHIEELLPVRLASLFFFDGERIRDLAHPEKSRELLRTALHALLGLDLVDQLDADLITLTRRTQVSSAKSEMSGAKADAEAAEQELADKEDHLRALKGDEAALQAQISQLDERVRGAEQTLQANGGDLISLRSTVEREKALAEQSEAYAAERLRTALAGDAPLVLVREALSCIVEASAVEERAKEAQVVLGVLENRDTRMLQWLDTHVDAHLVAEIRTRLDQDRGEWRSLAATSVGMVYDLTPPARADLRGLLDQGIERALGEVRTAHAEIRTHREAMVTHDRILSRIPTRESVDDVLQELTQAQAARASVQERLNETQRRIKEATSQRDRQAKMYERLVTKISVMGIENERLARRVQAAQTATACLARFRTAVLHRHVRQIAHHVTESYRRLLHKKSLIKSVQIDPDTYAITLVSGGSRQEQVIPIDDLSAGECQLLATSLLWGLAKASHRPLPMVIDTPVGRLDDSHRTNLLEFYFPKASHQVVLLSTDTEIVGKDQRTLAPYVSRFITLKHDEARNRTVVTTKDAS